MYFQTPDMLQHVGNFARTVFGVCEPVLHLFVGTLPALAMTTRCARWPLVRNVYLQVHKNHSLVLAAGRMLRFAALTSEHSLADQQACIASPVDRLRRQLQRAKNSAGVTWFLRQRH